MTNDGGPEQHNAGGSGMWRSTSSRAYIRSRDADGNEVRHELGAPIAFKPIEGEAKDSEPTNTRLTFKITVKAPPSDWREILVRTLNAHETRERTGLWMTIIHVIDGDTRMPVVVGVGVN